MSVRHGWKELPRKLISVQESMSGRNSRNRPEAGE